MYSAGTILYAVKDGVAYYSTVGDRSSLVEKSKDQYSDPIRNMDELIGTTTGQSRNIAGIDWIQVDWINSYKKHGIFGIGRGTENEPRTDWVLSVEVNDATMAQLEEAAAADKAAADAKRKQALIDAVGSSNPNLTANSGTSASSSYVGWIVGGVLVFVAGLVVWKIASKPKVQPAIPQPQYVVPRPKRLR